MLCKMYVLSSAKKIFTISVTFNFAFKLLDELCLFLATFLKVPRVCLTRATVGTYVQKTRLFM